MLLETVSGNTLGHPQTFIVLKSVNFWISPVDNCVHSCKMTGMWLCCHRAGACERLTRANMEHDVKRLID